MKNLRNKLQRATDDIRSGWKSKAGKKFFSKFDDEWLKNFNDYIDVIEYMSNNMSIAQSKYRLYLMRQIKLICVKNKKYRRKCLIWHK